MKFNRCKALTCLALVVLFIVSSSAIALAAPHLEWCTTAVYYDDGQLIIKGYFYNNGTRSIDRVNELKLQILFRQNGGDWWVASSGYWYDFDIYLDPGDSRYYNLRIKNPNYYRFDHWKVLGNVNYHIVN